MMTLAPWISCMAGMALLYGAWSGRLGLRAFCNVLGWALITASLFLWIPVSGPEFGPVYAFLVMPLAAWVFVLADPNQGNGRGLLLPRAQLTLPERASMARQFGVFLVAVPLAALTSALLAVEISTWFPWTNVDRVVAGILAMPVIWGLLAWWVCAARTPWLPGFVMLAAGMLSALALFA